MEQILGILINDYSKATDALSSEIKRQKNLILGDATAGALLDLQEDRDFRVVVRGSLCAKHQDLIIGCIRIIYKM